MSETADDRARFEEAKRIDAGRLAGDPEVARLNLELTAAADRHNWSYLWSWLGVPIIQSPTDVLVLQEIVWEGRPQLIVETGVARGGSVVFFSSLLELLGEGEVVGIDIDIRPHNRETIESHPTSSRVTLIEGSSVDPAVVAQVRARIAPGRRVMVVLDSNHTHDHVLAELEAYAPLVTRGQFLVVADTIVEHIPPQRHRPRPWGPGDNPDTALRAYMAKCGRFQEERFVNDKLLLSSSPAGYLRCIAD